MYGSFGPLVWCLGKSALDVCCSFIVSNLVVLVFFAIFTCFTRVHVGVCVSLLDSFSFLSVSLIRSNVALARHVFRRDLMNSIH